MNTGKSELRGVDQEVATASPPLINSKNHRPGRELDALVAEKVMGWRWYRSESTGRRALFGATPPEWFSQLASMGESLATAFDCRVPHYSTDISDAWKVVEKLREDGWCIDIRIDEEPWDQAFAGQPCHTYNVSLLGCNRGRTDAADIRVTAESMPHAICLAALQSARLPDKKEGK